MIDYLNYCHSKVNKLIYFAKCMLNSKALRSKKYVVEHVFSASVFNSLFDSL